MKNITIFIFICFLTIPCFAQKPSPYSRSFDEAMPDHFEVDIDAIRKHIYDGVPDDLRDHKHPRKTFRFADIASIHVHSLMTSGQVYSDWSALEKYINKILEHVIPPELQEDKQVKAYIVKDGNFNAYMTPSGAMFIHIGLFAEVHDEATLASILCHELAHYYLRHSVKTFVKAERGEFNSGVFLRNRKAYSLFSVDLELESDSLGFIWMANSGYNVGGALRAYNAMQRLEAKTVAKLKDVWELEEHTHPSSERRIDRINHFETSVEQESGADFLISESAFKAFQKSSKIETLNQLLLDFDYHDCIELAFRFHLFDAQEPAYIYYILEAIRQAAYINAPLWKKNFITFRYYEDISDDYEQKKRKLTTHLFESFPSDILCLKNDVQSELEGGFYWEGDPKFTTYEEAFDFFTKVSELYGITESLLTIALSYPDDEKTRNEFLNKYLASENIQQRDFAQNLLEGSLRSNLENTTLSVFSDLVTVVRQGKEKIPIRSQPEDEKTVFQNIISPIITAFPNRKFVFLSDFKSDRMNEYIMLTELEYFSFIKILAQGKPTDLFILSPRYWNLMNALGVHEIEFINSSFYDDRKFSKDIDEYQAITNLNHAELFSEVKRHRYFESIITSVRGIEGLPMKTLYFGEERKLDFKDPSLGQITSNLMASIEFKDQETAKKDAKYRKYNQKSK